MNYDIDFKKLSETCFTDFKKGDRFICAFYGNNTFKVEHTICTLKEYIVENDIYYISLQSSNGGREISFAGRMKSLPLVLTYKNRIKKKLWGNYIYAIIPLSEISSLYREDSFLAELSGDWYKISRNIKSQFIKWKNIHG
jgi:hypothetical protein